jgi:hypothetical protein
MSPSCSAWCCPEKTSWTPERFPILSSLGVSRFNHAIKADNMEQRQCCHPNLKCENVRAHTLAPNASSGTAAGGALAPATTALCFPATAQLQSTAAVACSVLLDHMVSSQSLRFPKESLGCWLVVKDCIMVMANLLPSLRKLWVNLSGTLIRT